MGPHSKVSDRVRQHQVASREQCYLPQTQSSPEIQDQPQQGRNVKEGGSFGESTQGLVEMEEEDQETRPESLGGGTAEILRPLPSLWSHHQIRQVHQTTSQKSGFDSQYYQ